MNTKEVLEVNPALRLELAENTLNYVALGLHDLLLD